MTAIPKNDPKDIWLRTPGRWRPATIQETGKRTATVSCPKCGNVASLSGHEVVVDGTVTPSLGCPWKVGEKQCDFHDWIKLEGWEPKP